MRACCSLDPTIGLLMTPAMSVSYPCGIPTLMHEHVQSSMD